MANFNFKRVKELSENQKAAAGFIKFFVFVIIIGVVIYSEYMFIGIISVILPDGLNKALALVGAVATGASVLALVAAKMLWVTPGGQMIWAWIFTGIEVLIMIMNDMLAYNLHQGNVDGPLATWQAITPASPVMALVGWMVLLFLDRAQRERHKDMDMQAKKADAEREYLVAAHEAEMDLRHNHLNQVTGRLQEVLQSDAIQMQIMRHAEQMVARVLTDVSGISAMSTSSQQPPVLPSPQQASFAQQTPASQAPSWPKGKCNRCGKSSQIGDWRREGEEPVWYCQDCVDIMSSEKVSTPVQPDAIRNAYETGKLAQRLSTPEPAPQEHINYAALYDHFGMGEGLPEFIAKMNKATNGNGSASPK